MCGGRFTVFKHYLGYGSATRACRKNKITTRGDVRRARSIRLTAENNEAQQLLQHITAFGSLVVNYISHLLDKLVYHYDTIRSIFEQC